MSQQTQPRTHAKDKPSKKRRFRASWAWLKANTDPLLLIVALLATFGGVPGLYGGVHHLWYRWSAGPISNASILAIAQDWKSTQYLNFGEGAKSTYWVYSDANSVHAHATASNGLLDVYVTPGRDGGYAFFLDEADNATLPVNNYFLSAELGGSRRCVFGLTFNAEYARNSRFAWLYVDNTYHNAKVGLEVSPGKHKLIDAFKELPYSHSIDNFGIIHYNDQYVIEVNHRVVNSIDVSTLTHLDRDIPLTGPGIGVGTYTCGGPDTVDYKFSAMTLKTP